MVLAARAEERATTMLRFDHLALSVSDLATSAAFYESLGGRRVSKPSPHFIEIMLGELRMHLVAAEHAAAHGPGACIDHFCASVASLAELAAIRDLVNRHPSAQGHGPFEIQQSPPMDAERTGHCEERVPSHTLYFRDPDGIHVEVRLYLT